MLTTLRTVCAATLVVSVSCGGLFKPFTRGANMRRARGPVDPFRDTWHARPGEMMPGQLGKGISFDAVWRPPFEQMDAQPNTSIPLQSGLEYLRKMLQMAIQIEHSTIPLYLTSLYSIKDAGSWPATVVRSVAIEEMLHMTVAANILNAIGGHPAIDRPGFVPEFPEMLPLVNCSVSIEPFSRNQAYKFRLIERPLFESSGTGGGMLHSSSGESISQFYSDASQLMQHLVQQYGEKSVFVGDPKLQVGADCADTCDKAWHQPPKITGVVSAVAAMLDISEQGAGMGIGSDQNVSAGPFGGGVAHFARFNEIYVGKLYRHNDTADGGPTGPSAPPVNVSVFEFAPNPRIDDYEAGSPEHAALSDFAGNYTQLLTELHQVFNGNPGGFMNSVGTMYGLRQMATDLFAKPDPKHPGKVMGPAWQYIPHASKFHEWYGPDEWPGISL